MGGTGSEVRASVRSDAILRRSHRAPEAGIFLAPADVPRLRAHARNRGWSKLRLLSGGDSTFKFDLGSEDEAGNQDSTISVLTLDPLTGPDDATEGTAASSSNS